jgi:hypothetical protein
MSSVSRYYLPESNRLLYFFLSDAGVAKETNAYKPVGDYVLMLGCIATNGSTIVVVNRAGTLYLSTEFGLAWSRGSRGTPVSAIPLIHVGRPSSTAIVSPSDLIGRR